MNWAAAAWSMGVALALMAVVVAIAWTATRFFDGVAAQVVGVGATGVLIFFVIAYATGHS